MNGILARLYTVFAKGKKIHRERPGSGGDRPVARRRSAVMYSQTDRIFDGIADCGFFRLDVLSASVVRPSEGFSPDIKKLG
jgi:hypothetical protein